MGQKWTKSAILWPKMLQMTPNLDWKCIQMVFIDFQNFVNFRQFLADFWAKKRHFFADAAKIFEKNFRRKIYLVLGKCFNWSSVWYKCSPGYPPQSWLVVKQGITPVYTVMTYVNKQGMAYLSHPAIKILSQNIFSRIL